MPGPARAPRARPSLTPRVKCWLNLGPSFLLGPNYLRFLRAVDETGTIRAAGAAVGWSYRTCLNRVRRLDAVLGTPALTTVRGGAAGGGARLTPTARRLVERYEAWLDAARAASDRAFARIFGRAGRGLRPAARPSRRRR